MDRCLDVVRLFPERGKFVSVALACLAVGLSCLLKAIDAGPSLATLLGAAFFLLGAINCLQSLDRSRCHIELGPEGFVERSPLRARLVRWSEVDEFDLLPLPRRRVWVVYRLAEPDGPRIPAWVRGARPRVVNLSDTYGLDAVTLVDLLNDWRGRFASDPRGPIGEPS
ncbi:hypothetical protein [Tautonia plasticadhaerens]|uniref:PH domain-containing protein n=1 Tax=Tautonia plasticadhaerens TaxID=2527974 RepID=A0A518HBD3_9BACT|nr:hypothetical protein [Tautonia plasticadhaerens]QDV38149.1 hypothetical protein ElP_60980 [Tautonia plasticadhaerens]